MRDNATKDINNTGKKSDGSDDDSDDVWDSDEYGDEDSNSDDDHDSQSNDAVDGGSTKRANEDPEMMEETKTPETPNEADNLDNILAGDNADESDTAIFELKVTLDSLMTPMTNVPSNSIFC
jgi:hypothetical protein